MKRLRRLFTRYRVLSAILLALAFALRVLVPQGWMPAQGPAGELVIVLCSGSGAEQQKTIPIDVGRGHGELVAVCPFAALADASDHSDAPILAMPHRAEPDRLAPRAHPAVPLVSNVPVRPPSQGPPLAA